MAEKDPRNNFGDSTAPHYFTPLKQPSPEAKRRGWMKRLKNRELMQFILEKEYLGNLEFRARCADYFQVPPEDITNEAMLMFMQIERGIHKQDTNAFDKVMERAYGKAQAPADIAAAVEAAKKKGPPEPITGMRFKKPVETPPDDQEKTNDQQADSGTEGKDTGASDTGISNGV